MVPSTVGVLWPLVEGDPLLRSAVTSRAAIARSSTCAQGNAHMSHVRELCGIGRDISSVDAGRAELEGRLGPARCIRCCFP